jgi:hypothetical protein
MKRSILIILIVCLAIMGTWLPVRAQMATMDEALNVANNWITLIIQQRGYWGGSETAEVVEIQEFMRGARVVGYFCTIKPHGFIVISLRKELAPVKAYSAVTDLNPESEAELSDLIKGKMERILIWVEGLVGPVESARTEELDRVLEINYRNAWEGLAGDADILRQGLEAAGAEMNYQEGGVLLTSAWHQEPPYNDQCPDMGCAWPPCNANQNALVGCVCTAGAQIMRYWSWPPSDPYGFDWPNMPDSFTGCTWPQVQVDAVAELCHECGVKVGMNYGCDASSVPTAAMRGVYVDHYAYSSSCGKRDRNDHGAIDWFNRMKAQFNANRPVHYRVEEHSIVGDGWQEVDIGGVLTRQYHMNYGWGWTGTCQDGCNTWYTLDALYLGGIDEEYMLENIYPWTALFDSLSDWYPLPASTTYRYFDRDATGESTLFASGHNLQFLPGVKVTCTGAAGEYIRFVGMNDYYTCLFSRGDLSRGIWLLDGAIHLYQNGSIRMY